MLGTDEVGEEGVEYKETGERKHCALGTGLLESIDLLELLGFVELLELLELEDFSTVFRLPVSFVLS